MITLKKDKDMKKKDLFKIIKQLMKQNELLIKALANCKSAGAEITKKSKKEEKLEEGDEEFFRALEEKLKKLEE